MELNLKDTLQIIKVEAVAVLELVVEVMMEVEKMHQMVEVVDMVELIHQVLEEVVIIQ